MPLLTEPVMLALDKILLATDFSRTSDIAASYAKALAFRFSSIVEIAHILDSSPATSFEAIAPAVDDRRQIAGENLEHLRKDFCASGIKVQITLQEGRQTDASLLSIANEQRVDLIVAGTQSKSILERLILGSTAEQLIRKATCPVLTVGPNAKPAGNAPLAFQSIVYATDFSAEASKASTYALSFAQDSGARLYFCHVLDEQTTNSAQKKSSDKAFRAALKKMIPESAYDWCTPECVVEHGNPSKAILELAARIQADLIVLGARKASFWLTHIDQGLTPDLLAQATCPVMTVC